MRVFIYKLMNVFFIAIVIFTYQSFAQKRDQEVSAYNKQTKQSKKEWEIESKKLSGVQEVALYQDGEYMGTGKGYGGEIEVSVSIKDGKIANVKIVSAKNETPDYIKEVSSITEDIVAFQDTDVDVISGATLSSNGVLDAVDEALAKAEGGKQ
ncbi:MAG: FMN-binding protein [Eubacterium sp.]|nr:FMN-binding protein [Eubacterium sp.]